MDGRIKLDKCNYNYTRLRTPKEGNLSNEKQDLTFVDLIRVSDSVTGSLSFIMVEPSNDEKTPKSYNKETKSIISRSMRLEDYGKSIIFRNKRYPRNPIHSQSDKFFNKVKKKLYQKNFN